MTATEFRIGTQARCTDGVCGHMTEVVLDSPDWTVTHLLVEPTHRSGLGRLVPLDLVETVTDEIALKCSVADFDRLARGERTGLIPGSNGGYGGYGLGQAVPGDYEAGSSFGVVGGSKSDAFDPVVYDVLPAAAVAVHGEVPVKATDGDIGRVKGLGLDRGTHRLTHVLLQEGHLWGHRQVSIPVAAVTSIDDSIHLSITKQQVEEDLPTVDTDEA